jgi:hypothetical protein
LIHAAHRVELGNTWEQDAFDLGDCLLLRIGKHVSVNAQRHLGTRVAELRLGRLNRWPNLVGCRYSTWAAIKSLALRYQEGYCRRYVTAKEEKALICGDFASPSMRRPVSVKSVFSFSSL